MPRTFIVTLLLLCGCLSRDNRPLDEFLSDYERFDTGTNDTGTPDTGPTGTDAEPTPLIEPTACSTDGGAAVNVSINNASGRNADLYWSDSNCDLLLIVSIPRDGSTPLNTTVGHAFWLSVGGRLDWIDEMVVEDGVNTYTLGEF